jgi:hypothetical protein
MADREMTCIAPLRLQERIMKSVNSMLRLAVLGLAGASLAGCVVYDQPPPAPAYSYAPPPAYAYPAPSYYAYPPAYYGPPVYGSFGLGFSFGGHHHFR